MKEIWEWIVASTRVGFLMAFMTLPLLAMFICGHWPDSHPEPNYWTAGAYLFWLVFTVAIYVTKSKQNLERHEAWLERMRNP